MHLFGERMGHSSPLAPRLDGAVNVTWNDRIGQSPRRPREYTSKELSDYAAAVHQRTNPDRRGERAASTDDASEMPYRAEPPWGSCRTG